MFLGSTQTKDLNEIGAPMHISAQISQDSESNMIRSIVSETQLKQALFTSLNEHSPKYRNTIHENNQSLRICNQDINWTGNNDVVISCHYEHQNGQPLISQSLVGALFPNILYIIVDKNMELQPKPLREFSKFKYLSEEDGDRQVLVVFGDPRQAKRLCGRTERVIKLPDPTLLGRTASYLLVRGITRILLDGVLYSIN